MPVDYHTHHDRCGHAHGSMIEYARTGVRKGLREIGLSDHAPIYHFGSDPHPFPYTAMPQDELPKYVAEMQKVKETLRGAIIIRLGIESDYLPELESHYRTLWDGYPLDYRIGSVHWLGDWSIFSSHLPEHQDPSSVLDRYVETTKRMVKSGIYDIVGHVDALKTVGHASEEALTEVLSAVVPLIAQTEMAVEFNTSGWRKPISRAYPGEELLRLCYRDGVPITLSSDAHRPQDVARGFDEAISLLWRVGYREVVGYERRRPVSYRLPAPA